jgi:hypothetical protein
MHIRKGMAYVPANISGQANAEDIRLVNALVLELANYGWLLDIKYAHRLANLGNSMLIRECALSLLKQYTVAANLTPPLFKNWESRTKFTFPEIAVQILGYIFQFSGNDINDPEFVERVHRNVDVKQAKTIELMSESDFADHFENFVNASTALDREALKSVEFTFRVIASGSIEGFGWPKIRSAEIRVVAIDTLYRTAPKISLLESLELFDAQPVDVLRWMAYRRDGVDAIKLPADVRYFNPSWKERRQLLQHLEGFPFEVLAEGMCKPRTAWYKFGVHIHLFEQPEFGRYQNVLTAFAASASFKERMLNRYKDNPVLRKMVGLGLVLFSKARRFVYRSYDSRVDFAISTRDVEALKKLCKQRPGGAIRTLTKLVNGVPADQAYGFVQFLEKEIMPRVKPEPLLKLLTVNPNAEKVVTDVKGKTFIRDGNYGPVFKHLHPAIKRNLRERFGVRGQIVVDPELCDRVVPFMSRNSQLERGTRTPIPDCKYAYVFVHWIQPSESRYDSRSDLDLSCMSFNKHGRFDYVGYRMQAAQWCAHSGDLTTAPHPAGATEYVKIRLADIPSDKLSLFVGFNVFAGPTFGELDVCRAGFLFSDSEEFELSQDAVYYDVTSKALLHVPFCLDLTTNEMVTLGFDQSGGHRGQSLMEYSGDLRDMAIAVRDMRPMTISNFAELLSGDSEHEEILITDLDPGDGRRCVVPSDLHTLIV